MAMNWLTSAGSTRRMPCGTTTRRIALAVAHAQRPAGLELAAVDALDAGAEDLADVGAGDQAQGQDAQRIRATGRTIDWLNRAKPWPISRMVRIAGRPRKMSV